MVVVVEGERIEFGEMVSAAAKVREIRLHLPGFWLCVLQVLKKKSLP